MVESITSLICIERRHIYAKNNDNNNLNTPDAALYRCWIRRMCAETRTLMWHKQRRFQRRKKHLIGMNICSCGSSFSCTTAGCVPTSHQYNFLLWEPPFSPTNKTPVPTNPHYITAAASIKRHATALLMFCINRTTASSSRHLTVCSSTPAYTPV